MYKICIFDQSKLGEEVVYLQKMYASLFIRIPREIDTFEEFVVSSHKGDGVLFSLWNGKREEEEEEENRVHLPSLEMTKEVSCTKVGPH